MNRSFARHPEEGGGLGGERNVLGRNPEGQDFTVLGSCPCRILLCWALVDPGWDYDRWKTKRIWKDPYSSPSSSPWLHSCISLSVLPTSLVMEGAVCWLKPIQNIVDSTPSAYCKWIHFYCGYCNGSQMINVNKDAFSLGNAQWY